MEWNKRIHREMFEEPMSELESFLDASSLKAAEEAVGDRRRLTNITAEVEKWDLFMAALPEARA